jgi:hypothetical protein
MLVREAISPWLSTKRRMRGLGVLLGATVVVGAVVGIKAASVPIGYSKPQVARATVIKYAEDAYPQWRREHPQRQCPASLVELNDYMNNKDILDPWGQRYHYACGKRAVPASAHGIWVVSAGADGVFGTDDDLRSDR